MVAASLALLKPGGCMVELGKRDIWVHKAGINTDLSFL